MENRIKAKLTKQDLIHLICGQSCGRDEKYARACGNQWVEDWEWDRGALDKLSLEDLADEYFKDGGYYVIYG